MFINIDTEIFEIYLKGFIFKFWKSIKIYVSFTVFQFIILSVHVEPPKDHQIQYHFKKKDIEPG